MEKNISALSQNSDIAIKLLKNTLSQSTELAENLIKINIENAIDINQMENLGNVIDTYI